MNSKMQFYIETQNFDIKLWFKLEILSLHAKFLV